MGIIHMTPLEADNRYRSALETDIRSMSALELGRKIRLGELTVREVVDCYRRQIDTMEPKVHAFLSVDEERLERRIKEVEDGIKSGRYQDPLAGVPIAVKDNICTKGQKTTCGSRMLENFVPTYDAEVVTRLEAAGMIVLGKTNMDEFAMGSTTETSAFGATCNPWNTEHVPGGSSGGSCAAVAAGEAPLALGSDTGGSIRQPAAYCGVIGLKPTYGRVSRYGLIAYASSMDQIGPIGKDVADCGALFEVIVGRDEKDSTSTNPLDYVSEENEVSTDRKNFDASCEIESCSRESRKDELSKEESCKNKSWTIDFLENLKSGNLSGTCIGVPKEYLQDGTDEEVKQAILHAVEQMKQLGAEVEFFNLPMVDYVIPAYYIIACAEASSNLERFDGVKYGYRNMEADKLHEMLKKSRGEGFGEEVKRRILLGSFVLSAGYYDAYYLKALRGKALIKEAFDQAFQRYDCILAPVAPTTAPKLGSSLADPLQMYLSDMYTVSANLAGLPAISLPCGRDKSGLPIGMQLMGNCFEEKKILSIAAAYEKARGAFPMAWEVMA